jgi:hypothetical protein
MSAPAIFPNIANPFSKSRAVQAPPTAAGSANRVWEVSPTMGGESRQLRGAKHAQSVFLADFRNWHDA